MAHKKEEQQSFAERAEVKGAGLQFVKLVAICVVLVVLGEYFGCIMSP